MIATAAQINCHLTPLECPQMHTNDWRRDGRPRLRLRHDKTLPDRVLAELLRRPNASQAEIAARCGTLRQRVGQIERAEGMSLRQRGRRGVT